jgi:uncharacterized protein (TIGR03086 family)
VGSDVVALDERAGGRLHQLVAAVRSDQWGGPTPCDEWTVRDLVVHIVAANVKYAEIARGADFTPGAPDVQIGDDLAGEYLSTLNDMLAGWREPGALTREMGLPRGQRGPAEVAAWLHLAETLCHGWDLASSIGLPPGFDDDVVAASLEECRRRMPRERVAESPFGNARDAADGPLIDQLAAYLGRDVTFRPD